jgi:hypothetical protein
MYIAIACGNNSSAIAQNAHQQRAIEREDASLADDVAVIGNDIRAPATCHELRNFGHRVWKVQVSYIHVCRPQL